MIKKGDKYKSIPDGAPVTVLGVNLGYIEFQFDESKNIYSREASYFFSGYEPVSKADYKSININSDIIKLIEAGYEFKSFFGTTIDEKDFSVSLEG